MTLTCPVAPTPPTCPLTGEMMQPWLHVPCDWRRPGVPATYDLYWSPKARYGQLYPRPAKSEIAAFYDVDYYTHGGQGSAASQPRKGFFSKLREHLAWRRDGGTDITAARLAEQGKGVASPAILEIGCGDGKLLADMRATGWTAIGVEPDPAARKVAAGRGLEVHDGTAEEPPAAIQNKLFDLIVMQHVLEHCLDPLQAVRVAASYLKPNGVMVIEVPNNEAAGCRATGTVWPWLDVPRHLNFFTAQSLRQTCSAAGLKPIATEYTGYTRQFQSPWLENERHIRKTFQESGTPTPMPNLSLRAWGHLARTAFAPARYKYDSVRVVARNG